MADGVRRVQALHPRRLPGRVPHRGALPHRVRHGRRAGRRVQRLRLLRRGLPVRGHRAPSGDEGHEKGGQSHGISIKGAAGTAGGSRTRTPVARRDQRRGQERRHRPEVHPLLRPARRTGRPPRAPRRARRRRSSSATSTRCAPRRGPGSRSCTTLGFSEARLYGVDDNDGVGGTGSTFLLLDEPEVYGLPPDPRVTTADLPDMFRKAGYAGLTMLAMAAAAFVGRRK